MNWFYVLQGQQAGPVSDEQLDELLRNGQIQQDTLIWREGMANWAPYSEAKGSAAAAPASAPAKVGMSMASSSAAAAGEGMCVECGKMFPTDNLIRHGNSYVCAACKPVFMQRLAEGATIQSGPMNYAGIGLRFSAVFLDGLILFGVNTLMNVAVGIGAFGANQGNAMAITGLQIGVMIFQTVLGVLYESIMIAKFGATLGKMACKIRVVNADGSKVTFGKALGRYFAKLLSSVICLIGYIMAAFDDEKRALHDRICNTRVVTK